MKKAGIVLIIFGNILNIFSGVTLKRRETDFDIKDQEITKETESEVVCPPWAGTAFILAGGIVYLVGLTR
jgi:hypothetical protein